MFPDLDNEIEKELAMSDETLDKDLKPPEIEIDGKNYYSHY